MSKKTVADARPKTSKKRPREEGAMATFTMEQTARRQIPPVRRAERIDFRAARCSRRLFEAFCDLLKAQEELEELGMLPPEQKRQPQEHFQASALFARLVQDGFTKIGSTLMVDRKLRLVVSR